ncbi:GTP pyrophosphokinase family protein [Citricoccus sp. I39-566]|uniref:GTP pyrophosphokinase n=1 Tax=Citricoccus sp. I39-566 TaxID=3073268 RepID=UPI00286AC589|nr:GTP pyrophosphokinase family protein [Citricoccus sp. I39-566]WMY78798.1 GTP pyrophosphokinase family protein [Citricoccus sp. I39-566]
MDDSPRPPAPSTDLERLGAETGMDLSTMPAGLAQRLAAIGSDFRQLTLEYEFALREVETKMHILQDEFLHLHDYNPIEHVSTRLKTLDSLVAKSNRRELPMDLGVWRREILDIAGTRVTCSFRRDVYRVFELFTERQDVEVISVKDYIAQPKANGYSSLHATVRVPVYLSTGVVLIPVEIQFRTIAMDFWASLDHKIKYKYDGEVPADVVDELREAAQAADDLDRRMESLHDRVHGNVRGSGSGPTLLV